MKEEMPGKNDYARNFSKMPVTFGASDGVHFGYVAKF